MWITHAHWIEGVCLWIEVWIGVSVIHATRVGRTLHCFSMILWFLVAGTHARLLMIQVLCIRMFPISILLFHMWPSCLEPWTLPSCLTSCAFHQLRLVVPCPNLRSSKNARAATTLLVPEREPMDIKEKRVGRAWRKPSNKTTLYSGPSFAFCSAPGG